VATAFLPMLFDGEIEETVVCVSGEWLLFKKGMGGSESWYDAIAAYPDSFEIFFTYPSPISSERMPPFMTGGFSSVPPKDSRA
jgi:hypothetical protein